MNKFKNPDVAKIFESYPQPFREKLLILRQLIIETASETEGVLPLEEALKWGEPSYLAKTGSTIRLGWKKSNPDQYLMYFHCKTSLLDTFKELYGDILKFEGNRAIIFNKNDKIPVTELKYCILLSLTYHQRKHLPMLGA